MTLSAITALLRTDAYKLDHRRQYPEGTTKVYANFTNRGSRIPGISHVVHFGLQAYIKRLQEAFDEFFAADRDEVLREYDRRLVEILGPNNIMIGHIAELWELGYLPLEFRAVPEGTLVPIGVPSFTVENTHPDFFWLTNYIETDMSANVWGPSTSATIANRYRGILENAALATTRATEGVDWQLHDFSYRGMYGSDAAAMSGAGHLLSFTGSDSLGSLEWIERYYSDSKSAVSRPNGAILGSVPATEHSVMCAGGKEDERETFKRLLKLYPSGIVSVVSDTWDLWNVVQRILPALKTEILDRDGKLVIRPDSGDPVDIICGTALDEAQRGETRTPEQAGLIELLWNTFGGSRVTGAGGKFYKVLDSHIGAIYGDSITLDRAYEIVTRLARKGFASTNIVLGVGSFTYQYVTRDTFSSAIKATYVEIDGEGRNIQKDPKTDNGTKRSATGRLAVIPNDGELMLVQKASPKLEAISELQPTWRDGNFVTYQSFGDVRARLAQQRSGSLEVAA